MANLFGYIAEGFLFVWKLESPSAYHRFSDDIYIYLVKTEHSKYFG